MFASRGHLFLARIRTGTFVAGPRGSTRQRHASSVYHPQTASDRLTSLSRRGRSGGATVACDPLPLAFHRPDPTRPHPAAISTRRDSLFLRRLSRATTMQLPSISLPYARVKSPRLVPSPFDRLRLQCRARHPTFARGSLLGSSRFGELLRL